MAYPRRDAHLTVIVVLVSVAVGMGLGVFDIGFNWIVDHTLLQ